MKKNVKQIILVIGLLTYLVGTLIASMSEDYGLIAVNTYLSLYPIFVIAFCFAQSKALNATGYTINAIAGINALTVIVSAGEVEDFTLLLPYIGLIIMFVASFCYLVPAILKFFGFVKAGKSQKTSNEKIELLDFTLNLIATKLYLTKNLLPLKQTLLKETLKIPLKNLIKLKNLKSYLTNKLSQKTNLLVLINKNLLVQYF